MLCCTPPLFGEVMMSVFDRFILEESIRVGRLQVMRTLSWRERFRGRGCLV